MNSLLIVTWSWLRALPSFRLAATPPPAPDPATTNLCSGAGVNCSSHNAATSPLTNHIQSITDTLLTVAGAVAVIIIIIGGITYVTSTGDSTRIKQAKDTILYAVVGLVVVILAYAIVNYVAGHV